MSDSLLTRLYQVFVPPPLPSLTGSSRYLPAGRQVSLVPTGFGGQQSGPMAPSTGARSNDPGARIGTLDSSGRASVPTKGKGTEPPRAMNTWIAWTPQLIRTTLMSADSGNFDMLGKLAEQIMSHTRVKSALKLRVGALKALTLDATHDKQTIIKAFRGYWKKSRKLKPLNDEDIWVAGDFWRMFPSNQLSKLMGWGLIAGMALVQVKWEYNEQLGRQLGRAKVWHLRWLRQDQTTGQWFLKKKSTDGIGWAEIEIRPNDPNDGEWFLWTPYGDESDRPWADGIWRGLCEDWLLAHFSRTDWARHSAQKGKGLTVGTVPEQTSQPDRDKFAADLDRAGEYGVLVPPHGYDAKFVESDTDVYKTFLAALEWFAAEACIALLGGNLMQQVSSGSLAAAQVHAALFELGFTTDDADTLSSWLATGMLRWWANLNFGAEYGPVPRWVKQKDELAERKLAAEVDDKVADAAIKLQKVSRRFNGDTYLESRGIDVMDDEEMAAKEAKDEKAEEEDMVNDDPPEEQPDAEEEDAKAAVQKTPDATESDESGSEAD